MMSTSESTCTVADMVKAVTTPPLPLRVTAYDGSAVGPRACDLELHVVSPKALSYIITAPGELGLARAYIMGQIVARGVEPGDPYRAFDRLEQLRAQLRRPSLTSLRRILTTIGRSGLRRPDVPDAETPPAWRRALTGVRPHTARGTGTPSPPTTTVRTASTRWSSAR